MQVEKQIDIVEKKLKKDGCVTRNWCLQRYITRLSSIILKLKKKGYRFEAGAVKNRYKNIKTVGDYKYKVVIR